MLQKHGIFVSQDDVDRVDTLRYLWQKLHSQVSERLTYLLKVQPQFKASLTENVEKFQKSVNNYVSEYTEVNCTIKRKNYIYIHTVYFTSITIRKDQWLLGYHRKKHQTGWSSIRFVCACVCGVCHGFNFSIPMYSRHSLMTFGGSCRLIVEEKTSLVSLSLNILILLASGKN